MAQFGGSYGAAVDRAYAAADVYVLSVGVGAVRDHAARGRRARGCL